MFADGAGLEKSALDSAGDSDGSTTIGSFFVPLLREPGGIEVLPITFSGSGDSSIMFRLSLAGVSDCRLFMLVKKGWIRAVCC